MNAAALATSGELAKSLATPGDTRDFPIRNSHLKAMAKSAAHCRHAILNNSESSLSKRLGSGVHSLLLGGQPVLMYPGKQRKGKDFDLWLKDKPGDALVYLRKEYERAHGIANAIKSDRLASQVLFAPGTIYEQTILWDWLGRKRRCTPDARTASHLVDLKTTRNASPEKFRWDVIRFGYHAQMADYANAIETSTGVRPRDIYIVAVETIEPYPVVTYRLTPNDLEQGERLVHSWMERLLICEATGDWPGYSEAIVDLDLPDPDGMSFDFDDDGERADVDLTATDEE